MEMTIEQKAKAYDEVKKSVESLLFDAAIRHSKSVSADALADIIPELKENEDGVKDERIRKAVISTFKSHCSFYEVSVDEVLAWFEKRFSKSRQKEIDDAYLRGISDAKQELGKQVEKAKYHDVYDECVRQPICQSDCFLQQEEQKLSEWSEEDERMYKAVSIALSLKDAKGYLRSWHTTPEEADNWLKSLKERVQPKQEWSEEDKNALKVVTDVFGQYGVHLLNYPAFIHWLKTLPNRITFNPYWRPSDEQMDALNYYATTLAYHSEMQKDLRSLWEDLKKLTE